MLWKFDDISSLGSTCRNPLSQQQMSLQLEETSAAGEGRLRVSKAVKWVPLVGKGVGRAGQMVWRAMRRTTRVRRGRSSLTRPSVQGTGNQADYAAPGIPFWSVSGAALWDLSTPAMLTVSEPPSWLPLPLQQLFWPFEAQKAAEQSLSTDSFSGADGSSGSGSCRKARRRERRAARQQRRAYRSMQKQLQKASKAGATAAACTAGSAYLELTSNYSSSSSRTVSDAEDFVAVACGSGSSGGWGTQMLAHMINPANTFPMLLHSALHLQQQQQQQQMDGKDPASTAEQTSNADAEQQQQQQRGEISSSSVFARRRPQQLLTVGCRHWGNGVVQGLGLKVKTYDFAIYLDGQQAQAHLPATALTLEPSDSQLQQQQQQQQGADSDLPAVLKSSRTPVDMSLVLKAARDVPLHLLASEYEKVLRRRLDRVGGNSNDITALQQLLATFSDANRLPQAVTASSSSTSSSDGQLPGAGAGGSVRKGAMIVFERNRAGDITARVGPVVLGTVSSPKVAEALFDLYLGEQPVSKSAKEAAAQTLQRIAAAASTADAQGVADLRQQEQQLAGYYLPTSKGQEIQCEGQGAAGKKGRKKKGVAGAAGAAAVAALDVEDLGACVLHMG